MSENIKNWVIGGLIGLVLIFGIMFLQKSSTPPPPPPPTITITENCISAQEAWNYVGQEKCVEYYVASPFRSGKENVFLNEKRDYKNGFTVWIPSGSISNFSGDPVSTYGYKTIQVTGQIRMYQGHPEIIANSPDQISVR
jgi:DNA/RNA endonuclease YhcR with UshA esterase domain